MNNFISSLLGFEEIDYVVDGYFEDTGNNSITIQISSKPSTYVCLDCGSVHCNIHSRRPKKLIHSNFTSKACNIIYNQKRLKCMDCSKTFLETNYFASGFNRISDITLKCILKDLKTTDSYINIANRYHVTSQTVLNYMDRYIDPQRRKLPEVICIDEFKNLSFGKGKYACLLINYHTGEIIDVLPNRQLDYLQYYFNHIPDEEKRNVRYVVSDMYEGYKHLASLTFPKAKLVIDAFHYIRYISEAFNKVRIRIMKQFKPNTQEYKLLKKYWKIMTKDSSKFENPLSIRKWSYIDEEMNLYDLIQEIKNTHPDIKTAYLIKEDFFASYRKVDYEHAESYLHTLINSMINSNLPEFIDVANTFKHWFPYIVNSFMKDEYNKRMSNGKIEGCNNKIKVIKKIAYGYGDFYHLRNRIMYVFNENELPRPIPKDTEKIKKSKLNLYKTRKK